MKNNLILYLCICLLIISNIFLFFKYKNKLSEIHLKDTVIAENAITNAHLKYLESSLFNTLNIQNLDLKNVLITSLDKTTVNLDDVIKENTLIYFYNENDCEPCINFGFIKLNNKVKTMDNFDNVIVIANCSSVKDIKIAENTYDVPVKIYKSDGEILPFKINVPCYFTVDKDMSIINFFVPEKTSPDCCEKFLDLAIKKYL